MITAVSSPQNPRVKQVIQLAKRHVRDRTGKTVVEGGRELALALQSGVAPFEVFVCPQLLDATSSATAAQCYNLARSGRLDLLEVTPDVYAKIAYRDGAGGLLAVIPALELALRDAVASDSLALVVESPEKPGNLGALLRTADAAGVGLVIVCGEGTDIHNPNVIRASLGAVFAVPVVQTGSESALEWLRAHGYRTVATSPDAAPPYTKADLTGPLALVMGGEAQGLSRTWLDGADALVRIPMHGKVDSLNLSVSTAILLFEAIRQRDSQQDEANQTT